MVNIFSCNCLIHTSYSEVIGESNFSYSEKSVTFFRVDKRKEVESGSLSAFLGSMISIACCGINVVFTQLAEVFSLVSHSTEQFLPTAKNNFSLNNKSIQFKQYIDDFIIDIKNNIKNYNKSDYEYIETIYNYLNNEILYIQYKYILNLLKVIMYILKCNGIIPNFNSINGLDKMDFYIIKNITLNNV